MTSFKSSRKVSFLLILLIYVLATAIGWWVFDFTEGENHLVRLFEADFWATVVVWFFGVLLKNSSVYDPYWSVAPPLLLSGYAIYCSSWGLPVILLLAVVWYWAIRLTANWGYTFKNLTVQDWRYDMYKERYPRAWHLVNFFGINLMPTLVVFFAILPGILLVELNPEAGNIGFFIGCLICAGAVTLQWVSDSQAHRFRRDNPGKVCNVGLWKRSRHPNYLGEILMWWGVGISYVSIVPSHWFVLFGALANTMLFLFISVPMMEKRQLERKSEYAAYKENTRMF